MRVVFVLLLSGILAGCATAGSVSGEVEVRVFDVEGVEIVVVTNTEELPANADIVRFEATIIDAGSGPELCIGGVALSLPPQCSGPVLDGLSDHWWTDEAQGVRWGDRSVEVHWGSEPLDVIEDNPVDWPTWEDPARAVPDGCDQIEAWAPNSAVHDYARSIGDRNGGVYLLSNGELALQVTDDPIPHREALSDGVADACVISVPWSEGEYRTMSFNLQARLADAGFSAGGSAEAVNGRFDVYLPVVDEETAALIADLMTHPEAVRVTGLGSLLDR